MELCLAHPGRPVLQHRCKVLTGKCMLQEALSRLQQKEAELARQEDTTQKAVKVCDNNHALYQTCAITFALDWMCKTPSSDTALICVASASLLS